MNTQIKKMLKVKLNDAKYYESKTELLDDIENTYIADHVNEKNVMYKAQSLREENENLLDDLTCLDDVNDLATELEYTYGIDVNDSESIQSVKDALECMNIIYIDEDSEYYIF